MIDITKMSFLVVRKQVLKRPLTAKPYAPT